MASDPRRRSAAPRCGDLHGVQDLDNLPARVRVSGGRQSESGEEHASMLAERHIPSRRPIVVTLAERAELEVARARCVERKILPVEVRRQVLHDPEIDNLVRGDPRYVEAQCGIRDEVVIRGRQSPPIRKSHLNPLSPTREGVQRDRIGRAAAGRQDKHAQRTRKSPRASSSHSATTLRRLAAQSPTDCAFLCCRQSTTSSSTSRGAGGSEPNAYAARTSRAASSALASSRACTCATV
jgi:hypothetical protein